jgi:hypothetical protein
VDPVARYLASAPPSRIAFDPGAGAVLGNGTLYGPGGRDRVLFQVRVDRGVPSRLATCPSWMAAVVAGHSGYAGIALKGRVHDWVAADPAFVHVAGDPRIDLWAVRGVPGARCAPSG